MLNSEVKKRIDNLHDLLVGQLPLPSERLELITVSLIYKFMEDMDNRAKKIGGKQSFFVKSLTKYSWSSILEYKPKGNENAAAKLVENFSNALRNIAKAEHIPEFFRSIFSNISLRITNGKILKSFMDDISKFEYTHSEELGNAFEYLLKNFGNQKENGQFRTPRNIIHFIVNVVDPKKNDTILDPACGTAGFLIEAATHIKKQNTSPQYQKDPNKWGDLLKSWRGKLSENIQGYDNTPLMVRLSKVNMFLHQLTDPQIHEYDTISSYGRWNDKFDVILANPPFMTPKGGIKAHDKFKLQAKKAEVLFSDYILEHLKPGGRAGIIVPEGIIGNSSNNDFVELRKWALKEMGLWAVVSLPAQIFQPYSGVKTSILFIDRNTSKTKKEIILLKVENDGFSLNTNRSEIKQNDLPEAEEILMLFKNEQSLAKKQWKIKFNVIPKVDFEKLDVYRASSTAWKVCNKAWQRLDKVVTELNEKLQISKEKRSAYDEQYFKAVDVFKDDTGIQFKAPKLTEPEFAIPISKEELKELYGVQIKDEAIKYGTLESIKFLSDCIKDALDHQREYNLGFETRNEAAINSTVHNLVRIDQLFTLEYGKPLKEENRTGGNFPVFGSNGIVGYHNEFLVKAPFLVVGRKGSAGSVHFSGIDGYPIDTTYYVKLENEENILIKYAYYVLKALDLMRLNNSTGVPGLNRNDVHKIEIPLPTIQHQEILIAELDSYQRVIDTADAFIENYIPAFHIDKEWETIQLGELSQIVRGSSPRPKGDPRYYGGSVPRLMVADVTRDGLYTTPRIDTLTKEGAELSRPMRKGDVIITVSGNPGLPTILACDACIHDGFVGLRNLNTDLISPEFLYFVLLNFHQLHKADAVGAVFQNLTTDYIKEISIPVPGMETQMEIVEELLQEYKTIEGCKKLKTKMEAKIKELVNSLWGVPAEEGELVEA